MPKPSVNSMPYPRRAWMTVIGHGAPPLIADRSVDRSRVLIDSDCATAAHMAGTRNALVTPCCSTASSQRSGAKASMMRTVPPTKRNGRVWTPSAPMWNRGAAETVMSVRPIPESNPMALTALWKKLPCVSMAPFGRPVVPEVYMSTQTSSWETWFSTRSGEPPERNAS